ncbi:MAG: hypothetical protein QOD09_2208 [Bradyrhizobium sp.]|nr:hypothetical protein [Bradyrhizobium sp.]
MISGTDPARQPMTGVPQAIASIIASPKGSGQSIGKSIARITKEGALVGFVYFSDELYQGTRFDHWFDDAAPVVFVAPIDLRGDLQRKLASVGDFDCTIGTLFRTNPAQESKIAMLGLAPKGKAILRQPMINSSSPSGRRHQRMLSLRDANQRRFRERS